MLEICVRLGFLNIILLILKSISNSQTATLFVNVSFYLSYHIKSEFNFVEFQYPQLEDV